MKSFRHWDIPAQIIVLAGSVLIIAFAALTIMVAVISTRAALKEAEQSLVSTLQVVNRSLDLVYEAAIQRAEREMKAFKSVIGGELAPVPPAPDAPRNATARQYQWGAAPWYG
jgi:hypothetical protein